MPTIDDSTISGVNSGRHINYPARSPPEPNFLAMFWKPNSSSCTNQCYQGGYMDNSATNSHVIKRPMCAV